MGRFFTFFRAPPFFDFRRERAAQNSKRGQRALARSLFLAPPVFLRVRDPWAKTWRKKAHKAIRLLWHVALALLVALALCACVPKGFLTLLRDSLLVAACCQPLCKILRWWRAWSNNVQAMTVDRLLSMLGQVLFTLPACFLVLLVALLRIYETKNTTCHKVHICSFCTSPASWAYHAPVSPGRTVSLQGLAKSRNSKVATPFV